MEFSFDTNVKTRNIFLQLLNSLSLKQLNTIPEGFNNNIFWNIKHVVITQQLLVYGLSNLPMQVTEAEVNGFRKGTKPLADSTQEDVDLLKKQLVSTLKKTQQDYKNMIFKTYNEYTVTTKSTLTSADEAIIFNNFHEGIHLGYVLALIRLV